MYLSVLDEAVGCVLGQYNDSGKREQAIYYLSKKFTSYEAKYTFLEKSCCALAWMILSEFDIIFTTQKAIKGQAIVDHLAENPRRDDYQPLHTYFPDEEALFVGTVEDINEKCSEWRLSFDGVSNSFGAGIGAILVSPEGKHYPGSSKLRFFCTNNMAEYEA
nr:uncharacterized protein LOC113693504 [Coffea arabica]